MTIKVHYDGKVFVPDEPVNIPAGTEATINLIQTTPVEPGKQSLLEWMAANPLDDEALPPDLAHQHDHYLYGTPKRSE